MANVNYMEDNSNIDNYSGLDLLDIVSTVSDFDDTISEEFCGYLDIKKISFHDSLESDKGEDAHENVSELNEINFAGKYTWSLVFFFSATMSTFIYAIISLELNKASILLIDALQKFPEDYYLMAIINSSIIISIMFYNMFFYGYDYTSKFYNFGEISLLMAISIQLIPRAMMGAIPRDLYSYYETEFRLSSITHHPSIMFLQFALCFYDIRGLVFTGRWLVIASLMNMIASYFNIGEIMTGFLDDEEMIKSIGALSLLLNIIFTFTIVMPTCQWLKKIFYEYSDISSQYSKRSIVYITTISAMYSFNLLCCLFIRLILVAEVLIHGEEGFNDVIACFYRIIQVMMMLKHLIIGIVLVQRTSK